MSTTRIFGNNPFEVFLKPTNKIEVKISNATGAFKQGSIVAYDSGASGALVLADASNRAKSSVLGVVTDLSNGTLTIVTQGLITVTPQGVDSNNKTNGDVYFLHENEKGTLKLAPPSALGTTRIPVIQVIDGGYNVLGVPGIVNGISYRGYVNIAAIQPVGTVSPFVGNTTLVPKNWLFCDGSYVSIDTYSDLFRMIGSIYGEVLDGRFKLPDFRGRTLVGAGAGSSLSSRFIGEFGGEEKHTISITEMPSHSHKPAVGTDSGVDHWWGSDERVGQPNFDYDGNNSKAAKPSDGFIAPSYKTDNVGGNSPHNNMPPYSVANWIIRAKAESEFALLDVNVESLTNVDKTDVPSNGDVIKYDGSTWRFVANTVANANDVTYADVKQNDILVVNNVTAGVPTFRTSPPSGSNINIKPLTTALSHKNGSPRPSSVVTDLGNSTDVPVGRKGLVHIHGTIEIEPTAGSTDGTVNINLTGYGGTEGLDIADTIVQAHYSRGLKKILLPFHATVMAQIYETSSNKRSVYKFSYYLSTETGSQFKANKLTINNVKFVY